MRRIHQRVLGGGVATLLAVGVAVGGATSASGADAAARDQASQRTVGAESAIPAAPAVTSGATYHEETFRGEWLPNSGHACGGKMYKTDSVIYTPAGPMRAYAWIFRNCRDYARYFYANVRWDDDGPCYGISANRTRTLEVKYILNIAGRNPFAGSKAC